MGRRTAYRPGWGGRRLSERLGRDKLRRRGGGLAGGDRLPRAAGRGRAASLDTWGDARAQFSLTGGVANFATWLLASHPRSVRTAIDRHRRGLDAGAKRYLDTHEAALEDAVLRSAATYLEADAAEIALTDSTTMGLALLYGGVRLRRGDVVLTSEHDFYATRESRRLRSVRDGVRVQRVRLYEQPQSASTSVMLKRLREAIGPRTRVLALT